MKTTFVKKKKSKNKPLNWLSNLTLAGQSYTSLISVLGGVSIYVGWTYCTSYFNTVDASWIINYIGVITMIKMSAQVTVPILMLALMFYSFIAKSNNKKIALYKIDKYMMYAIVLCSLLFSIMKFIFGKDIFLIFQYSLIFFVAAFSSSAILRIMIDVGSKDYSWGKVGELALDSTLIFSFLVGPSFQASIKASSDMDHLKSNLPIVYSELLPADRSWRLLTTLDNAYVLVSLAENSKDRLFKVLNVKEPLTITASRR